MSFTGVYVSRRKLKRVFFIQINKLINWDEIETLIKKYYNKGFRIGSPKLNINRVLKKKTTAF